MSEPRPTPPRDASPEGPSHNRRIPPLVWVILALVVAMLAIGSMGGLKMNHAEQAKTASTAT
jgi:hypothetical protein